MKEGKCRYSKSNNGCFCMKHWLHQNPHYFYTFEFLKNLFNQDLFVCFNSISFFFLYMWFFNSTKNEVVIGGIGLPTLKKKKVIVRFCFDVFFLTILFFNKPLKTRWNYSFSFFKINKVSQPSPFLFLSWKSQSNKKNIVHVWRKNIIWIWQS